jgi:hypothetical protein
MRTRDHVVPKSQGGIWTVPACLKCNGAKGDKSLEEFRRIRGGVEFWAEGRARQEREKTDWIYAFDSKKKTVIPSYYPRPAYISTTDLSKYNPQPSKAQTKKEHEAKIQAHNMPPDLRGQKFGALNVIRYILKEGWEVVCICGAIEVRTTRAVRNPANSFDACIECRKPVGKLRSDIFKETGVEVSWDDCFQYVYGCYLKEG